jgi:hypothetical protein
MRRLDRPHHNETDKVIVMAFLTLSQTPNHANSDHAADDFTVGQRVKAHPATDTFMRGDVYGTIQHISSGPKR